MLASPRVRNLPVAPMLVGALSSADNSMPKPTPVEAKELLDSPLETEAAFALLAFEAEHELTENQASKLFEWSETTTWGERAGRALKAWWKYRPEEAWPIVNTWTDGIGSLVMAKEEIVLEGVIDLASFANRNEAEAIVQKLRLTAMVQLDPYSDTPVEQAQRSMARLLPEYPALAVGLAAETLDAASVPARRNVLLQALGLRGPLRVEEHLTELAPALATTPEELRSGLKETDDKYSVADPLTKPAASVKSRTNALAPWASIVIGLLCVALLVAISKACSPSILGAMLSEETGAVCRFEVPDSLPNQVLPVLLPLLGITVAVHILAIDLASGRFPRKGASTVATASGFLAPYGFLVGCILFEVSMSYFLLGERDSSLFAALGSVLGLLSLVVVIREVLRSQDVRMVARRIAAGHRRAAKVSGRHLADLAKDQAGWERERLTFRWIKSGLTPPTTRRSSLVTASHRGFIKYDLRELRRLDEYLGGMNDLRRVFGGRSREIVLLKSPGVEVSAGEDVSAILTEDPPEVAEMKRGLRRAVSVSRSDRTIELQGALQALATLLQSAAEDGDLGAAREIGAYLTSTVDQNLEAVDRNAPDLGTRSDRARSEELFPSSPELQAVLALERALRALLDQQDDFLRETVKDVILDLASAAKHRGSSSALEYSVVRTEIVARGHVATHEVTTLTDLLSKLGHIAYESDRSFAQAASLRAMERLCEVLTAEEERGKDAGYCVERYTETLAMAMRLNYFASNRVLEGAKKLSDILRSGQSEESRQEAQVGLLELGGAAFEAARYSLALAIADVILSAGIDLNAARRLVGSRSVSASLQTRTALVGEAFGANVEAVVKRYVDWLEHLPPGLVSRAS